MGSIPIKIFHNGDNITKIVIKEGEDVLIYQPRYIISSIPLTEFVYLMDPNPSDNIICLVKNLKYRSHISLFITINKNSVFREQWIYFPDKEIPFARIMEPKNFSKEMSPKDRTSLLVEFFCWEDDEIYNMDKKKLLELSFPWLETLGFIKKDDIIDYYIHKERFAYPVYALEYKKYLKEIKGYLNQFKNLQIIGRCGAFKYNNQDHALEMGRLAAKSIIENRSYNIEIENIGTDNDYFEKNIQMRD